MNLRPSSPLSKVLHDLALNDVLKVDENKFAEGDKADQHALGSLADFYKEIGSKAK